MTLRGARASGRDRLDTLMGRTRLGKLSAVRYFVLIFVTVGCTTCETSGTTHCTAGYPSEFPCIEGGGSGSQELLATLIGPEAQTLVFYEGRTPEALVRELRSRAKSAGWSASIEEHDAGRDTVYRLHAQRDERRVTVSVGPVSEVVAWLMVWRQPDDPELRVPRPICRFVDLDGRDQCISGMSERECVDVASGT